MYYGNYTDGLIAGRQQGHQLGYDEGHSDGRKKGEQIGYDQAWYEAGGMIDELRLQVNYQTAVMQQMHAHAYELEKQVLHQEAYIDELKALLEAQDAQVDTLTSENAELQGYSDRLRAYGEECAAFIEGQEKRLEALVVENTDGQQQRQRMHQQVSELVDCLKSGQVYARELETDREWVDEANKTLVRVFNHTMLVMTAVFAAFEEQEEPHALSRAVNVQASFERHYFDRLEYALKAGLIGTSPDRDADLQVWAPQFSDQLFTVMRRVHHISSMAQARYPLCGPFPDLITSLIMDGSTIRPVLVDVPDDLDEGEPSRD
ncbi:hypothetical protein [Pseudomonas putida]|uniref:hypothetical protein n=1 Tax=Pseudomonas putida TaxID=303 RepID=UPI00235CD9D9|nr:hypothetical protein [Pseudomonas putida]GLO25995.1 hypothetical protein PPUJ21368_38250 [Pseudomonas putida]HDS0969969.1 hypothetical protein [Pseudomonas putida]